MSDSNAFLKQQIGRRHSPKPHKDMIHDIINKCVVNR